MFTLSGNHLNPRWASINLGGSCNNHCKFCYTKWTRQVRDLDTHEVKEAIDRIRNVTTVRTLNFTGGEPTIREDLESLFEYANEVGFDEISLQTNARELRKIERLGKLVERGLKSTLVSLDGPNEGIHDTITRSPGSFKQTLNGLFNLQELSVDVTLNVVMCKDNCEYLVEIVDFLDIILSGKRRLRFSYPIIEGAAFDNLKEVCVSFTRLKPKMLEAMQHAETKQFEVEAAGMPLCVLAGFSQKTVYDRESNSEFLEASVFNRDNIPRGGESVKLQVCKECSKIDECLGIQIDYLRYFPDSYGIFVPFTAE